ncbi:acyltransferase family protein [Vogesella indigofera]|uniref:acyltransferase family protein n=1 Tax=Vogesella indigofera TaxID=45465 RepID=UPI00234F7511|nr:acyltransferase [Vogesella indigofera]MDC7702622.1 acyltransferase [Vogesella indigofera]
MSQQQQHIRFDFADGLRGLAMLAVVLFHYTQIFWQRRDRIGEVMHLPPLDGYHDASFVLPFNLGAVGVGLFLLISGLLIPLSLTRMGAARFAVSRLFRIYPTYWAGLALTVGALWLASRLPDGEFDVSPADVLGHASIAFQDWLGGRNIDPVMWTLKVELWFYAMLGAAFALTGRRIKWAIWLLLPLIGWLCRFAEPNNFQTIVCYFPLMFAGCWLYFYQTGQAGKWETVLHFLAMLGLFVWVSNWGSVELYASYGIGVALFVAGALWPRLVAAPLLTRVAGVSYAWYVCHSVAGYAILFALAQYGTPWWLMVAIALAATWYMALAINRFVELPTQKIGKRLADKLK